MSARARLVLYVVGVIVVLALFFVFFIRPRQNELTDVRNQVEQAQDQTQALQAELERLQDLQARAPQLRRQLEQVRELIPRRNNVPNFIFQVQEAANRAGVGFL